MQVTEGRWVVQVTESEEVRGTQGAGEEETETGSRVAHRVVDLSSSAPQCPTACTCS